MFEPGQLNAIRLRVRHAHEELEASVTSDTLYQALVERLEAQETATITLLNAVVELTEGLYDR